MIVLLLLALVLGLTGLALLVRGLRPRRTGDTPHCARCNYTLTGNVSGRCPECGSDLSTSTSIVVGDRHKKPVRAVFGTLLLILALTGAWFVAGRDFDPYMLKPTGWVLSDLDDAATSARAWAELQRRMKDGPLAPAHRARLIDTALKEQGNFIAGGPLRQSMIDFLGLAAGNDWLSESQKKTFIDQLVFVEMKVRPSVTVGNPLPYSVRHRGAAPSGGGWWCNLETVEILLDGKSLQQGGGSSGFSGSGGSGSFGSTVPPRQLGPHLGKRTVTVRQRLRVYPRPPGNNPTQNLYAERNIDLSAEVDVVANDSSPFKRITDPTVAVAVRAALNPQKFMLGEHQPGVISGQIYVNKTPAPLAFDVFTRFNGREYPLGSLSSLANSTTTMSFTGWEDRHRSVPATITLVLKPSEAVARRTVDLAEYFDGEIVFDDVPVLRGPKADDPLPPPK